MAIAIWVGLALLLFVFLIILYLWLRPVPPSPTGNTGATGTVSYVTSVLFSESVACGSFAPLTLFPISNGDLKQGSMAQVPPISGCQAHTGSTQGAITDMYVLKSNPNNPQQCPQGYTTATITSSSGSEYTDFNQKCGVRDFNGPVIHICYTRDTNAGTPIRDIGVAAAQSGSRPTCPEGYTAITSRCENIGPCDNNINQNCRGRDVTLCIQR